MAMLDKEDKDAFKKLGLNLAVISAVAVALIFLSMYLA